MERKKHLRTDLAAEMLPQEPKEEEKGYTFEKRCAGERITVETLTVKDDAGERLIGKPKGKYVTVGFEKPWLLSESERRAVSAAVGGELRKMMEEKGVPISENEERPILVAGLGNRRMTADAVGPGCADKITVTGHLAKSDRRLFFALGQKSVCAIVPGVTGDTGIESAETVKAVASALHPAAVIAVDALAARSACRLARTVQICDTGISPGSGVGNDRPALNEEYLGVPVFALGVPTVVDCATMIGEVFEKAGIRALPESIEKTLEKEKNFYVSLKEIDVALEALTDILASAVDLALRR